MSIQSDGLDCYLLATTAATTTHAEITTAITTGKRIGKIKDMGEIGGSRPVQTTTYMSKDDAEKGLGAVEYGNINVNCTFEPADITGQKDLKDMFDGNTARQFVVKESDGAFTVFPCLCSSSKRVFATGQLVAYNAVVEQNGKDERRVSA